MPENSRNFQNRNRLGAARRRLTSFRDAFRSSRIFVCQEMTISLAVPDILVARAKSGDLEALEALYRAFETPVYNLALRMLRRSEDAEDVLQETFLEVVRSIKQYRGEGHLWGWVRQITVSKTLMRIRRGQLRDTEELHEEYTQGGSGLGVGGVPARIDLERAFERLTPTSRAVVWLHDVEGYTHEEIAERMERTVSFSKSQLARAHARLRRLLAEEGAAQ
ncbi:MAG: RNA polymerase sigma factor [Gemmatimonadetes bacterium]|nr:MAG: RNA polymerase subunit sigma-24 [Gemmatimonadota bacterium]TLY56753.1 MAG: RNA polymerase sigma factor [Gemmatimonadota bacterium]